MVKDKFAGFAQTPNLPANAVGTIVPSDEADLEQVTLALAVAAAGWVRVTAADGSEGDVFVSAGAPFPLRVRRVWATGTTATGIRGLY